MRNSEKNVIAFIIILLSLCAGYCFSVVFQPVNKSVNIYKQGLIDYKNEDYSNSYYLFSKIGFMSVLKSSALYRQAMCSKKLGDKDSELSAYRMIIKYYPMDKLVPQAKYNAGLLLLDSNPKEASKYFDDVVKSDCSSDFKIASLYLKSKIEADRILKDKNSVTESEKKEIESGFRNYLQKAPSGRFSVEVCDIWQKINDNLNEDDYLLIGKAYYLAHMYDKALEIAGKVDESKSWALKSLIYYVKNNFTYARYYTELGVSKYGDNVSLKDYKKAVESYLKTDGLLYSSISKLYNLSNSKNKDYLLSLKCKYSGEYDKAPCYEKLYKDYNSTKYVNDAMKYLLINKIANKDYNGAKYIADDFINKHPHSKDIPMALFWSAKIEQKYLNNKNFETIYKRIINEYPDSYYAYRSFWMLQNFSSSVMPVKMSQKEIKYPSRYPSKISPLYYLLKVQDYDLALEYAQDGFEKSWMQYKLQNYATSMHTAKLSMNKLEIKPDKTDLRWRLIYPLIYYNQINNQAKNNNNNTALMLAIVREESHFNHKAKSSVGATGLMQLMSETAQEIALKNNISFNEEDLTDPDYNIMLGNIYYQTLRNLLDNLDISAIASYNGGIGSVQRWKTYLSYNDTDEFVEQIPYEETRDYVKKVFSSYWNYIRIYQ